MKTYVALYPEYGGPAKGFRCEIEVAEPPEPVHACAKVTRTLRGMKAHLLRVHSIRIQGELFDIKQLEKKDGDPALQS